ncbi:MAG: 2Fe-2S iron-sulfur cluster binding domain-containing protein [Betaproteobacteria bacterium]|nr:2Fe-2S iron-sulfur cluster binding domain-containing protein [Betaproteobacteria bacterium]
MKIQVNARNRAYSFDSGEKEQVLFAGLRSAVDLPYECSTGTCGTCKAKLIDGKIYDPWPEAPGRKYLKPEQGEFLMCQCVARTDITIELGNFVYGLDPGACLPRSSFGVIRRTRPLTHDVTFLEIEPDRPQEFDAGQFFAVGVPGIPGYRGYSMVNFERQAKRLEFVIKKKPGGGFSEWLFNSGIEGTAVNLVGPLGHATFYPNLGKNLLCIAGGSGIAGMMSILSRAVQERYFDQHRGYLFFGVRTMKDTFFLEELSSFRKAFPGSLDITIALSDEDVPADAAGRHPLLGFDRGFVHEVAARHMKGKYQNLRAYLAGPPPAVDGAIRMLIVEAKLTTDNIKYDKFS